MYGGGGGWVVARQCAHASNGCIWSLQAISMLMQQHEQDARRKMALLEARLATDPRLVV